jgi:hypothetical protein
LKLGVGMFLITLFTGQENSLAEEFLLQNSLTEELKKLNNCIEVKINNQKYFIKARLIW